MSSSTSRPADRNYVEDAYERQQFASLGLFSENGVGSGGGGSGSRQGNSERDRTAGEGGLGRFTGSPTVPSLGRKPLLHSQLQTQPHAPRRGVSNSQAAFDALLDSLNDFETELTEGGAREDEKASRIPAKSWDELRTRGPDRNHSLDNKASRSRAGSADNLNSGAPEHRFGASGIGVGVGAGSSGTVEKKSIRDTLNGLQDDLDSLMVQQGGSKGVTTQFNPRLVDNQLPSRSGASLNRLKNSNDGSNNKRISTWGAASITRNNSSSNELPSRLQDDSSRERKKYGNDYGEQAEQDEQELELESKLSIKTRELDSQASTRTFNHIAPMTPSQVSPDITPPESPLSSRRGYGRKASEGAVGTRDLLHALNSSDGNQDIERQRSEQLRLDEDFRVNQMRKRQENEEIENLVRILLHYLQ